MENPFESGHIKNYVLLYVSVVVIMILFFVASTLFNEVKIVDVKVFDTEIKEKVQKEASPKDENQSLKFKLMDKVY